MLQRQAQQRSRLQNQLGTSSSKNNVIDLTSDGPNTTSLRPGPPNRAASALRLEVLQEAAEPTVTDEAPQRISPWPPLPQTGPKGRPKLVFGYQLASQNTTGQPGSFAETETQDKKDEEAPFAMPFPSRPSRMKPVSRDKARADPTPLSRKGDAAINTKKREKTPVPYTLEVPSDAPYCPSNCEFVRQQHMEAS